MTIYTLVLRMVVCLYLASASNPPVSPSASPIKIISKATFVPSVVPIMSPTNEPTHQPTRKPTQSPTLVPTSMPITRAPTRIPTRPPTRSNAPSRNPTYVAAPTAINAKLLTMSPSARKAIVNIINSERQKTVVAAADLKSIAWDYNLEAALKLFVAQKLNNNPWWFVQTWPVPPANPATSGLANFNGVYLFDIKPLPPQLSNFANYQYLFHDTYKTSGGIPNIFSYRANQRKCFNYTACNDALPNDNFKSCVAKNAGIIDSFPVEHPCSWFWEYYPRFLLNTVETIACLPLGIPGPFRVKPQDNSFYCYGRINPAGVTVLPNHPFFPGPRCSKCPAGWQKCVNGLCLQQTTG